ncbi:caspase family protein [Candidatus Lokiarchaeum ossiferum]|uniref:caspase family protein n=1 Tax=Candidatus Lokiarchaeum ossiferum TaxID=2951803 RepID=UPI00352C40EE
MKKNHFLVGLMALLIVIPLTFVVASAETNTRSVMRPGGGGGGGGNTYVPPPLPTGGAPLTGQKYALVIGISDYDGDSSDLTYCDDDAYDWRDYLESIGYQVTMLIDEQATEAGILAALQNLADLEDEAGDAVAICYSGHGSYSRTTGESCLVSWELAGVYVSEIKPITDTFQSEHVFFFDDACVQGTMVELLNAGWVGAIGSTTKTYTYDGDSTMQNGIFTYYAMEAINLGYTTGEAIGNYAVNMFDANTQGDATLYDAYTIGDLNLV